MAEEEEEEEVEGKGEVVEEVMKKADEKSGKEEGWKWEKEVKRTDGFVLLVVEVRVHLEGLESSLH